MSNCQHTQFMKLALAEAMRAYEADEVPIGAIIVRDQDQQLLASAHNQRETKTDPTAHAEMLAIRAAASKLGGWRLTGTTMYVTLEPCAMCAGALVLARIDRLVYGATDPKAGACGSVLNVTHHAQLNHRLTITTGVLAQECGELLTKFFSKLRN